MTRASRFLAVCLCLLTLSGCGFRPLYGTSSTLTGGSTSLDLVQIGSVRGSGAQQLENALIDRFYHNGYPQEPTYVVEINQVEMHRDIVIEKNDVISRSQLVLRADYTLREKQTRHVIAKGSVRAVGAYNILASQYTTVVTRKKARDLAIKEVADNLALRLAVVLEERK